jgi:hypothetical protein
MGIRTTVACATFALALAACGEQQAPEGVAGPSLSRPAAPTNPAACDPNSLNSLISGYFQGNSGNPIKTLKDAMVASPGTTTARNNGFAILDSIGARSRQLTVDTDAGSALAQGVIKCMFDAASFTPSFPSSAIYNFAPALDATAGGGFYTRGAGTGSSSPVMGAIPGDPDLNVLSGVNPPTGSTWSSLLAGNSGSEGRVLIYGYPVTNDPLVYEWATIPPAATFDPGAIVAICDGADLDASMINESTIGVLAYVSASPICTATTRSVVIKDTGWGPRALAARLARAVISTVQPQPLQAAMAKSGTGGTATTFKSKFSKKTVTFVPLTFTINPPKTIKVGQTVTAEVRATTTVDGATVGVNGVCVYLKGNNNNGQGTSLVGSHDSRCQQIAEMVDAFTVTKGSAAGYASFSFKVTKTGGLVLTATATDDNGSPIGVVGRNGQTFTSPTFKTNVKP